MKLKLALHTTLMLLAVVSCSHIDEDERLIYVKLPPIARSVLIEDFTGQRCTNCPKAADEIKLLQEQYGADAVVAVGIHSGRLGFHTNSRFVGLSTDVGDEYFAHWGLEYQPVGLINRSAPADHTVWNTMVRRCIEQTAPVRISIQNQQEGNTLTMQVSIDGMDGDTDGKLQLWLVEDNVTAFQLMPDGTRNDNYVHQHVLRAAVNGTWGEDVSVKEGQTTTKDYSMTLSDEWKTDDLWVVAFVYNETEVLQVTREKTKNQISL